jgi:hypothetical protein
VADAIGYVYREKNETKISFIPDNNLICGARSEHLRNKEISVATSDEEGKLTVSMKPIYTHIR